jgi:hypothetical protein
MAWWKDIHWRTNNYISSSISRLCGHPYNNKHQKNKKSGKKIIEY